MGEVVWAGAQWVGLVGAAYLFYGFAAGVAGAFHQPVAAVSNAKEGK